MFHVFLIDLNFKYLLFLSDSKIINTIKSFVYFIIMLYVGM